MTKTVGLFLVFLTFSCTQQLEVEPELAKQAAFPIEEELETFTPEFILHWRNVLPDQQSFISPGHSSERVRVYYNKVAKAGYETKTRPLTFKPGSMIAKAFVSDEALPTLQAKSIFFMRKHKEGYFSKGNDWEYGVAEKNSEGTYQWKGTGKIAACRPCHAAYPDQDFVLTVDRHQEYSGLWGRWKLWLESL